MIGADARAAWDSGGWAVVGGAVPPYRLDQVTAWVDELSRWARSGGPVMHHFEQTDDGPTLARSERFAEHHRELDRLFRGRLHVDAAHRVAVDGCLVEAGQRSLGHDLFRAQQSLRLGDRHPHRRWAYRRREHAGYLLVC